MENARVLVEVVAGLIPGQPMRDYTRRYAITSKEWYGPEETLGWSPTDDEVKIELQRRKDLLKSTYKKATDYAEEIMKPDALNWIRIDWIWL